MPQFPGGDAELYKFISQNLNYPAMAIENGVQGKVIVQFVVTKDGSIGNVKVVRSVDRDLDNEAIRVCKKLPKFIPGKQLTCGTLYLLPSNSNKIKFLI